MVELVETKTGHQLWAETYERGLSDIFASHGFLRKLPTWDALKGNPEFEQLLSRLKPIPIENGPQ